jgi:uncharacterized repeat protein (TIGR01451 family)
MKPHSLVLRVTLALALAATWILLPGASPVQAATCTWTGAVDNDWANPGNWTGCGAVAPGSGDTAIINAGTVNVGSDVTVLGLALSSGALAGSSILTVTEVMTWTGGTMTGSGMTIIAAEADLSLSGGYGKSLDGRVLDNQGTAAMVGTGNLDLQNGAIFSNTGTFDLQVDLSIIDNGGADPTFNNVGVFRKSGGGGTSQVQVVFNNGGTVEAQSGTLQLTGDGDHSGAFDVASVAVLQFSDGTHILDASATIAGAGDVTFSSGTNIISGTITGLSGLLSLSGGMLYLDGSASVPAVHLSSGTLAGSSILTVTEVMTWTGGTMTGSGMTVIAAGADLSLSGGYGKSLDGRVLDNQGTVTMVGTGNLDLLNGAIFSNTGTFDLQVDQSIVDAGGATFNNAGIFGKSGGGGTSQMQVVFNNGGTVEAQSGTLQLTGDGDHSGAFDVASGAVLQFSDGTHILDASATIAGAGDVTFSSGTNIISGTITGLSGLLSLSGGTLYLDGSASVPAVRLSSGTLGGSSILTVTEVMTWTGGTMTGSGMTVIAAGADLGLSGGYGKSLDGRVLDNQGTVTMVGTGNLDLLNGAVFSNTGTFDLQVNQSIVDAGGATFNNAGTFRKAGGGGTSQVQVVFNNGGTVEVQSGTLQLTGDGDHSGAFDVASGAVLQFSDGTHTLDASATIAGAGDVIVSGATTSFSDAASIACGSLAHQGGTLNLGDISIAGDLVRSGGTFNVGSGTVTFNGSTTQNLELNTATTFHNLVVASGTTLVETVAADNATIDGELINQGVIRKTLSIVGTGLRTFGLTGAALNVSQQGALSSVQVDQVGADHPQAIPGTTGGRYWTVTPDAPAYIVDLTLPHTCVPTDVQVCRYTGGDWDCARSSATGTTVTREGITQLSDWIVRDASGGVDLALDKVAALASLPVGGQLVYTITIENQGPLAGTNVTISDTLLPDLAYGSATTTQGACAHEGGVVSCTLGTMPPLPSLASSTFDADADGWVTYADADDPVHAVSGGNPGGHICATDQNIGQTWYFQAPSEFHGDFSDAYGQVLTFDLKQSATTGQFDDPDVVLIGGTGVTLGYDTSYNPGATWTFYRVPLHESGWVNTGTSQPATQGEMRSVLADLIALRIRGEFFASGVDTGCLDNVKLYGPPDGVTVTLAATPTAGGFFTNTAEVAANEAELDLDDNVDQAGVSVFAPEQLAGVVLLGPGQGTTGIAYAFTAIITPAETTPPITYTWSPEPDAGGGTAVATYTWSTPGLYPITVWAADDGGAYSDTHTVAISPPPAPASGDDYEEDDACGIASSILTDGTTQVHTFHDQGDEDWVSFTATAGITYVVEARVPSSSTADLTLALYDACDGGVQDGQAATFSPDVRLVFTAPASGSYYLQLSNDDPAQYGAQVSYHLSVRAFEATPSGGALVIVAGRLRQDDPLQANIHHVTTATYRLARANGCTGEQIYYLATDPTIDADGDGAADVDALSTKANLEQAITEWAAGRVGPDNPFTLYLMDHGGYDKFYLDGQTETLTPGDLDGWLTDLETATGVQVSVIVEACHSGSFIDPVQTVSQDGRVVMASTGPNALAYASQTGASFSDVLLNALGQGQALGMAFEEGRWATRQAHPDQTPWLDANGNGAPNETDDELEAALHAFACAGVPQADEWAPHIVQVNVTGVGDGMVEIWAQVEDDESVKWAWAVVYPPSDLEPVPGEEFRTEPLPVTLQPRGYDWYGGLHMPFEEPGEYRIVVYAQDGDGLEARPEEFRVQVVSWPVYLPVVVRQN